MTKKEESVFFIKPPALHHADKILRELKYHFDEVQWSAPIALSHSFWLNFHKDEVSPYKEINADYLAGKQVILGIVKGKDAEKRLFNLCGTAFRPKDCSRNSIRYRYPFEPEKIKVDGIDFYINAIHRSLPGDATREVRLVRPYISRSLVRSPNVNISKKQRDEREI